MPSNHLVRVCLSHYKLDQHRRHDLNPLAVEKVRSVLPLLHCLDCSLDQQRMPTDYLNLGYISVTVDQDTEQDRTGYVLLPRLCRIAWVDFCNKKMAYQLASDAYTAMDCPAAPIECAAPSNFISWQTCGSVSDDATWLVRRRIASVLREIAVVVDCVADFILRPLLPICCQRKIGVPQQQASCDRSNQHGREWPCT